MSNLLTYTPSGLYCAEADIYVDPNRVVDSAVITHAHSDHAKRGCKNYLAHKYTAAVMKHRLSPHINVSTAKYSQVFKKNGVRISLHPAGHIPGSAQVRFEYKGEVWVVTGDYKLENDGLSEPYEPLKCHTFITESTFAKPVYRWKNQLQIFHEINTWWMKNIEEGKISLLAGYTLGKAQRLFYNIDHKMGPVLGHPEITTTNQCFIDAGLELLPLLEVNFDEINSIPKGAIIICPPSITADNRLRNIGNISIGYASGWMIHGTRMKKGINAGFALSDHADWEGLNQAVKDTGAENIYVTHGFTDIFVNWLRKLGLNAHDLKNLNENNSDTKKKTKQIDLFG